MPRTKLVSGVPKFVTEPPSDKIKNLIKHEVKPFLKSFEPPLNEKDKPVDLIPEFIDWVGQKEPKFLKIKSEHIKTTFKMIAIIRDEIRNNINSILQAKKITPKEEQDVENEENKPEDA